MNNGRQLGCRPNCPVLMKFSLLVRKMWVNHSVDCDFLGASQERRDSQSLKLMATWQIAIEHVIQMIAKSSNPILCLLTVAVTRHWLRYWNSLAWGDTERDILYHRRIYCAEHCTIRFWCSDRFELHGIMLFCLENSYDILELFHFFRISSLKMISTKFIAGRHPMLFILWI